MSLTKVVQQHPALSPQAASRREHRHWWKPLIHAVVLGTLVVVLWNGPAWWQSGCLARSRAAIADWRFDEALVWIARSQWWDSQSTGALLCEARVCRKQGHVSKARELLSRAARQGHPAQSLRHEELLMQAQTGDLAASEEPLLRVLQGALGDESEICEALVQGYLRTGQQAKAKVTLDSWQRDFPEDWRPKLWQGRLSLQLRNWKTAASELQAAAQQHPGTPEIEIPLAQALLANHEASQALPLFRRSLVARPDQLDVRLGLARALSSLGEIAEAQKILEETVSRHPHSDDARLALGQSLLTAQRPAEAVQILWPAVDRFPNNFELRFQLGTALRLVGRVTEAEPHLAFAREAREELRDAEGLREQLAHAPSEPAPRLRLAAILLKYDLDDEGLVLVHGVLVEHPRHHEAHRLLADYYQRQAKHDAHFATLADEHRRFAK